MDFRLASLRFMPTTLDRPNLSLARIAACAAWIVAGVTSWGLGVWLLLRRWQGLHPAVFEADTYAQALRHGLAGGGLWPWDLTERFWPFFLIAPGIYAHVPAFALFPGGQTALWIQSLAVALSAVLLVGLAREGGLRLETSLALGLVWLVHPISGGVAMAWGWSPYASAAPLLIAGSWAMFPLLARIRRRSPPHGLLSPLRWRIALVCFALAALMKVNAALMVAGLGFWCGWVGDRSWRAPGPRLAAAGGLWVVVTGSLFAIAAIRAGTFAEDVHLADVAPVTAGGAWTVVLLLVPLVPLLDRRGGGFVLCTIGIELAYTLVINPANSGLVPATALLFGAAAAVSLPRLNHPLRRVGLALGLALVAHQLFEPPRLAPLPLQPDAWDYVPDPRGAELRAHVAALPAGATLVTFDPLKGAVGGHEGPVLEPREWDGRSEVHVLLAEPVPERFRDCVAPLFSASSFSGVVWAGVCGTDSLLDRMPEALE